MNRNDKILIAVLLAVAASFFFLYQGFVKENGNWVVITVDGIEYKTLSLMEDTSLAIEGANGGKNHLIIENGTVRMDEASCPDQVCVHQRPISYNGESIICLPNKVVIKVKSSKTDDVDAVQ
ncbi:NusG domain II-containing protein [Acetivibrio ethanolgignens]|uniref:Uncharacterized protein n=1 Tax=Acetivibrio ethanolgignens TaxID=290052 RepID=A0A0V8QB72_9FIRM|nr:NusG domain II-containing protein [Acetivibrio ethanolgignens]KSV57845.1 hypothetical protein ASU35_03790 [Acetivibrio ethanolgignens]